LSFSFRVNVKAYPELWEKMVMTALKKTKQKYTNITTDQFLHLFCSCSSRSIFIYDKKTHSYSC